MNEELMARLFASQADSTAIASFTLLNLLLNELMKKKLLTGNEFLNLLDTSAKSLGSTVPSMKSEPDRLLIQQAADLLESYAQQVRERVEQLKGQSE